MNTPSKEALEAAQLLVYSYDPKALEDDARSYDLIRPAIRSEFDLFRTGTRYYY